MKELKKIVAQHLKGGHAFMPVDDMLEKIPFNKIGISPVGLPYSFYELFSHMQFAQNDILDYCLRKDYKEAKWPDDYWPGKVAPENEQEWEQLKKAFFEDRKALEELLTSEDSTLIDPVPSNPQHSLMREVLLVIEHTAYHSGQLLILLRHLGLHSS
ncbi:DinB family protein [Salinimicrobium soli]|uniref:DinB family protein n=1 Tax=Salinimicrobium soli TaxID=1254399 RepID=UPI003AAFB0BB